MPIRIESADSDRVVVLVVEVNNGGLIGTLPIRGIGGTCSVRMKIGILTALGKRKPSCIASGEHAVPRSLHDKPGDRDRASDASERGYSTSSMAPTIHDRGIEFYDSIGVRHPAIANRCNVRIILRNVGGAFDGIERGSALLQDLKRGAACWRTKTPGCDYTG